MNYSEYVALTESTEINQDLYRAFIKEAIEASPDRLRAMLDLFVCLNVPADCNGDVKEIKIEGMTDIVAGIVLDKNLDIDIQYAEMIWLLTLSVSEALFHSIEQLLP